MKEVNNEVNPIEERLEAVRRRRRQQMLRAVAMILLLSAVAVVVTLALRVPERIAGSLAPSPTSTFTTTPTSTFTATPTATPTATGTATPTDTPTSTPTPEPIIGVATGSLTVFAAPDVNSRILGWIRRNDRVAITGFVDKWYRIVWSAGDGWVLAEYIGTVEPVPTTMALPIPLSDGKEGFWEPVPTVTALSTFTPVSTATP